MKKEPVLSTAAASNRAVIFVLVVLAAVAAFFVYMDDAPSSRPPKCADNEIRVIADGLWWCVLARKP